MITLYVTSINPGTPPPTFWAMHYSIYAIYKIIWKITTLLEDVDHTGWRNDSSKSGGTACERVFLLNKQWIDE